ncbi:MAG: hypothetical protein IKR60_01050, partial [Alphaproteobacteria bacterium]|nr:hypothetical protein [Alphaproteobacteria bacterium]
KANLMIEGSPKLSSDALVNTERAAIYCVQSIDCANKGIYDGVNSAGTVVPYERQAGVYRLEDGTIFSSPNDMMSGTNACADLDTCKAAALEYNGYCTGDACTAMVMAENTNHPIEYHNKSYASIDDLFEGKYLPKRIYTVEEARQAVEAAGTDTVNFRIRYK